MTALFLGISLFCGLVRRATRSKRFVFRDSCHARPTFPRGVSAMRRRAALDQRRKTRRQGLGGLWVAPGGSLRYERLGAEALADPECTADALALCDARVRTRMRAPGEPRRGGGRGARPGGRHRRLRAIPQGRRSSPVAPSTAPRTVRLGRRSKLD